MKHARKALVFLFLVVTPLLLAGVLPPAINNEVEATISPITTKVSVPSYEIQTPILAYNDFDMDNYASSLEWEGDGSLDTPYIIEGYNITTDSDSILIHDTTRAFEIRNCLITSYTSGAGNGIMINNATQAAIVNTVVMDKSDTIDIRNVPSLYIENCTIYEGYSSVYIENCTGATITECVIYDNYDHGLYLSECNSSMVSNNEIYDTENGAGIRLILSHDVTIVNNHIYDCAASGVWAHISHNATIENNIIHDNMFFTGPMCGVHLYQSDNASVVGNEIYDNSRNGIYVQESNWAYVFDNEIYGNSDHGIDSMFSSNGTILQNDIHGNGWWPMIPNALCGIYLGISDDWMISENTIWNNTPAGVSLENADRVTITSNEIFNNTDFGVFGYGGHESVILENQIYGNCWLDTTPGDPSGIYLNEPIGMSGGHTIANNEIHGNTGHGIYLVNGENHVVDSNIIHHNNFSIYVNTDGGVNVTNNIVYDNSVGIILENGPHWIYGNDFGWNNINALDVSFDPIHWTDNVSIGNWWSDYSGVGEYNITDGADDKGTDFFPSKSLDLVPPVPIEFEILETGNVLVWEASALNPLHYEVFINGNLVLNESWDGGDIEFLADGLSHGSHPVELEVYHVSGHSMGNSTTADVEDLTPPDIDGPSHIEIAVGETVSTQYSAEDPSGLGQWDVNDTVNFAIDSSGLLTSITDLQVGEYTILIEVSDTHGHTTFLEVTITVSTGAGLPTTMILGIVAGGAIAAIIVVIVILKKRGT